MATGKKAGDLGWVLLAWGNPEKDVGGGGEELKRITGGIN